MKILTAQMSRANTEKYLMDRSIPMQAEVKRMNTTVDLSIELIFCLLPADDLKPLC
jgi:hypothetical protein